MKRSILLFLTVTLIALIHNSCKNTPRANDYYPLNVGLKTEFTVIYYDNESNMSTGTAILEITGTEKINEKEYSKIALHYSGLSNFIDEVYYSRKDDIGIWTIYEPKKDFGEYFDIKYPLNIDDTWLSNSAFGRFSYKVERKENISLNEKEFPDCLKIISKNEDGKHGYLYLAKGKGLIKQTTFSASGKPLFEMTMKN